MVKEGILLGYKISIVGLEVDPAKIDVTIKDVLMLVLILIMPDWSQPFELMCDASDIAVGAMLGQKKNKVIHPIYYVSKTLNEA
ncbi:Retrovirus-related Pol polyprotein from transposon 17.6 [Cucumis melo var. makuwa]|uniref:Retrovirus-related Pol polyprotein from transposon 17.6 n=1 Tax=Cucumis melo var. makuwa TaxID=1194695 RepID=A0A5D3DE77_CUCMM|nr:Retrovirus-related Pol polyprotein from transposon 17.6 [Cucumis melo var. makuwa]TYK21991.1 Retrovirus-related Pol polyprotein from transposon 17.6 [Cucumis melo var. makuwa]